MHRFAVIAIVALWPATAFAQLPTAGEAMGKNDASSTNTSKVTELDFETDQVTAEIIRPLDEGVKGEHGRKTSSLIDVRANFVRELQKSVDKI